MNTPLMELIEKLNKRKELGYILGLIDSDESMIQINLAIKDAASLLEYERVVICTAYWDGGQDMPSAASSCLNYYTKTFTHESK